MYFLSFGMYIPVMLYLGQYKKTATVLLCMYWTAEGSNQNLENLYLLVLHIERDMYEKLQWHTLHIMCSCIVTHFPRDWFLVRKACLNSRYSVSLIQSKMHVLTPSKRLGWLLKTLLQIMFPFNFTVNTVKGIYLSWNCN